MTTLRQVLYGVPDNAIRSYLQDALSKFETIADIGMHLPSLDTPIHVVINELREKRRMLPDKESEDVTPRAFTRLDNILISLWQMQRTMDTIGPLDQPSDYVLPICYDVMLTDIKPDDLPGKISLVLGTDYLSLAPGYSSWPVDGKLWGPNRRLLLTLPVSLGALSVNVHFIFDTGAPTTYIANSVLRHLSIEEWELFEKPVKVNGIRTQILNTTSKHHSEVLKFVIRIHHCEQTSEKH